MKNIAVVCGGYSGESVVSMRSAKMVMENIDRSKFEPTQIVIEQKRWYALVNEVEVAVEVPSLNEVQTVLSLMAVAY